MKDSSKSKSVSDNDDGAIAAYSSGQSAGPREICERLRELIAAEIPKATRKIWHGSPVWFIGENPVVGYSVTAKETVNLLFWNGQAFDEPELKPVGKYRAAQAVFRNVEGIDAKAVRRWLKSAKRDVFDSKGLFKKMRERK